MTQWLSAGAVRIQLRGQPWHCFRGNSVPRSVPHSLFALLRETIDLVRSRALQRLRCQWLARLPHDSIASLRRYLVTSSPTRIRILVAASTAEDPCWRPWRALCDASARASRIVLQRVTRKGALELQ